MTKTSRDLFNPPPQAPVYRRIFTDDLRSKVIETYPDFYDERQQVLLRILDILEDHEERIGL